MSANFNTSGSQKFHLQGKVSHMTSQKRLEKWIVWRPTIPNSRTPSLCSVAPCWTLSVTSKSGPSSFFGRRAHSIPGSTSATSNGLGTKHLKKGRQSELDKDEGLQIPRVRCRSLGRCSSTLKGTLVWLRTSMEADSRRVQAEAHGSSRPRLLIDSKCISKRCQNRWEDHAILRLRHSCPAKSWNVHRSLCLASMPLSVSSAFPIQQKKSSGAQDNATSRQQSKTTAKFRKLCGGPAWVIQDSLCPLAVFVGISCLSSKVGSSILSRARNGSSGVSSCAFVQILVQGQHVRNLCTGWNDVQSILFPMYFSG